MSFLQLFLVTLAGVALSGCEAKPNSTLSEMKKDNPSVPAAAAPAADSSSRKLETATFGAGCFWCVEAVFRRIRGVEDVESGYMGGKVENPTYRQICQGTTGHAEVVRVMFDPAVISYEQVLEVFWLSHDPTTLNRQGADTGTQYRSAIFVYSDEQKAKAEASRAAANASGNFSGKIVTTIEAASTFWPAEAYHQDYYELNSNQGYCQFVISPKLRKLGLE